MDAYINGNRPLTGLSCIAEWKNHGYMVKVTVPSRG